MAIKQLTDEQVRTWSREQKDRWWLENVFRGSMPQLTLRSALTGFFLGGMLSATNLYVGAKSGWSLGVGITSVVLAFALYRIFARLGARDMTILENNCSQSIATAAGYMTGPLISGMAAYMWVQNEPMLWWQMFWFNVVLSFLGVLVAFPMKRRFINDEQQPFPEGRACGVVLDTMYSSDANVGVFKAKALGFFAVVAAFIEFLAGEGYQKFVQVKMLGRDAYYFLSHYLDQWVYDLAAKGWWATPKIAGVDMRQLDVRLGLDLALFGAGGLMGVRAGLSMLLGMVLNFCIIVPWMITIGELAPRSGSVEAGNAVFGRAYILNHWALWWGIAIMVTASMVALFAKPKVIISAFTGLFKKKDAGKDVLRHIELPIWISFVGVPIVGAVGVWMAHDWFGVPWIFGATAIPLIIVLTLIAANSTALTGITPTGALSKIPQFGFGALDPKHPPTNLMTGVMCVEVAANASNLLMDIKPGYMLGGKPRHQAIGHCIGIVAGALAATPLFYLLFLGRYDPAIAAINPKHVEEIMTAPENGFGFPSALQWKGVSDLVTSVFDADSKGALIPMSAVYSMIIAAVVGLVMEIVRIRSKGAFPLSPLAIGLGVVVPASSTFAMAGGACFFWLMNRLYGKKEGTFAKRLWVDTYEPICGGIIAGAALTGIGNAIMNEILARAG
ncbi:MAG: OPT/YSL family transporter [Phycisphaeraceae bacterium]|nr:MAG: OPT/YSL family transporter [Phycisphaeraceae bacterium]